MKQLGDVGKRQSDQLICLLHGPGGSGKTAVNDLLMEYAREYCSYLDHFEFTSRTIVVTAMTGVAATILMGETTHSAVYLNQKRPIEAEQVELWQSTRLLIIDEISFASKEDFVELHKKTMPTQTVLAFAIWWFEHYLCRRHVATRARRNRKEGAV